MSTRGVTIAFNNAQPTPTDRSMIFTVLTTGFGAGAQFVSPADNNASQVASSNAGNNIVNWYAPIAGTIKNFRVDGDNNIVSNALDFHVQKNTVDSTVTVHIPIGEKTGSDLTHSFTVAAGDRVCFHNSAHVGDEFGVTLMSCEFIP